MLPLEWRNVDFAGGEVRLNAGTTKNREGRVFYMTLKLRALLQAQHAEHERLRKAGQFEPWVFFRMVARRPTRPEEATADLGADEGVEGRVPRGRLPPVAFRTICAARPCGTWCGRGSRRAWR